MQINIYSEQCRKYNFLYKKGKMNKEWALIFAQKRTFIVKSVWVTHIQFPLRHAAPRTIHVVQSATFQKIT